MRPDDIHGDMGAEAAEQVGVAKTQHDGLGFVTSPQPNLSLPQVAFILAFATRGEVDAAAQEANVNMSDVDLWLGDPGFRRTLDTMLGNKREGVKQIGAQLLPLMLLELTKIIISGKDKEKLTAIKLQAQMQGLLITQTATADKGTLEAIREELMRPRPVIRTLPAPGHSNG
jgi:hypothetical protein